MPDDTMDNIRKHLKTLGLKRMETALTETLAGAAKQNLPAAAVLERLLEIEAVVGQSGQKISQHKRGGHVPTAI